MTSTPPSRPPRALRPPKELITGWLLLLLESGASYGYELRREFDAHRLVVDPSVLYRALRKLERDGAVQSRWMKSEAGPRRRFYRLTPKGRQELQDISVLIGEIRDLNQMFVVAHAALQQREAGEDSDAAALRQPAEGARREAGQDSDEAGATQDDRDAPLASS